MKNSQGFQEQKVLNGIEKVKIEKSVCEKLFYEGVLVSFMVLAIKFLGV